MAGQPLMLADSYPMIGAALIVAVCSLVLVLTIGLWLVRDGRS